jgi:hypothetical protein
MSKTTKTRFNRTARFGALLGLSGVLSLGVATAVRAQDDGYNNQGDDSRYNGARSRGSEDARYGADARYGTDRSGYGGDDTQTGDEPKNTDQDPPSRVARLSYLDGSVSFQAGGSGDWGNAAKNRPVTIGDKLWVDKDSRAELQAGQASIHLGGMTALSFLNLDQNITQMRLAEGTVNFRVRELREGDLYEVDTPNAAFTVRQAGAFRIDVNEQGDGTIVTAIRGEGEVTAGGKSYDVHAGELVEFNGTDADVEYHSDRAPEPDEFDRWAADRDKREENSQSARYVSRDMVGYSDLDDNGTWRDEPEYGHVWYPNSVGVGWAPYSNGYWGYVGPWGWTWIGYEPWGFAPYHYGRWNYFGGRWGWCPGPIGYYPVYGPAFVGFLGGGFGFGVGIGVGWFPLGFGEVYHPWYGYRAGGAYIRNINVHNTYIRNVNNINRANNNYAYAHNPAAVTATTRAGFANGQAVNRGATRVDAASLRGAQVTNRLNVTPTRASYTGASNARGGRVATPPASVQNRAVIARTAPAAGASHMPVRTVGNSGFNAARSGAYAGNRSVTNNSTQARPNTYNNSNRPNTAYPNGSNGNSNSRSGNNTAPATRPDRPSNAGSGSSLNSQGSPRNNPNRPPSANQSNVYNQRGASSARPYSSSPQQRGYSGSPYSSGPQQRGYSAPRSSSPSYSGPQRGYSAPSYSAPPRAYSAPSRAYSAPSHSSAPAPSHGSSGGGGGRPSGGGGGGNRGGGSGSHGR